MGEVIQLCISDIYFSATEALREPYGWKVSRKRKPGGGNRLLGVLNDTRAESEVIATLKRGDILDSPWITDIPEETLYPFQWWFHGQGILLVFSPVHTSKYLLGQVGDRWLHFQAGSMRSQGVWDDVFLNQGILQDETWNSSTHWKLSSWVHHPKPSWCLRSSLQLL